MKGNEGRSQASEVPFPIIVIAHTRGDFFGSGECSNTKRSPQHRKGCHNAKRKSGNGNKSASETCLPSVKHAKKKKKAQQSRKKYQRKPQTNDTKTKAAEGAVPEDLYASFTQTGPRGKVNHEGSSEFGQVFLWQRHFDGNRHEWSVAQHGGLGTTISADKASIFPGERMLKIGFTG